MWCLYLLIVPTPNPQDMLEFPAQELRKYFKMGDHVKVIAGRFEGDTGLIVRVEENFVILFSDLTMHEVGQKGGSWLDVVRGEDPGKAGQPFGPCFTPLPLLAAESAPPGPAALLRDGIRCGCWGPARMGGAGAAGPSDRGCHRATRAGDLPGVCAALIGRAYF